MNPRRPQPKSNVSSRRAPAPVTAPSENGATPWAMAIEGWRLESPDGRSLVLNDAERRLLTRLLADNGRLVMHAELIAAVTSSAEDFDPHRLEMLIHRLRRKVSDNLATTLPLYSVRGRGYVFHADELAHRAQP